MCRGRRNFAACNAEALADQTAEATDHDGRGAFRCIATRLNHLDDAIASIDIKLSAEEIAFVGHGIHDGSLSEGCRDLAFIHDGSLSEGQVAAFAMAVFFRGM